MDTENLVTLLQKDLPAGQPSLQTQLFDPVRPQSLFEPVPGARLQNPSKLPTLRINPERPRSFVDTQPLSEVQPVNIFPTTDASPELAFPRNQPPPPPPPNTFQGPFAELDGGLEKDLKDLREEAERANESAIRKQIEELKQIIASHNKN